jgi:hypothetical protein
MQKKTAPALRRRDGSTLYRLLYFAQRLVPVSANKTFTFAVDKKVHPFDGIGAEQDLGLFRQDCG